MSTITEKDFQSRFQEIADTEFAEFSDGYKAGAKEGVQIVEQRDSDGWYLDPSKEVSENVSMTLNLFDSLKKAAHERFEHHSFTETFLFNNSTRVGWLAGLIISHLMTTNYEIVNFAWNEAIIKVLVTLGFDAKIFLSAMKTVDKKKLTNKGNDNFIQLVKDIAVMRLQK